MQHPPIPTRWVALTGAPCSGKTTVIRELERRGAPVVHETARALIEAELKRGRTLDRVRADPLDFQRRVLRRKIAGEDGLRPGRAVFLDRGVPDSVAYFRLHGLDPAEAFAAGERFRYRAVLLLERLPFRRDAARNESEPDAARLESLLVAAYEEMDYPLRRVPVLPVAERVDFVLRFARGAVRRGPP